MMEPHDVIASAGAGWGLDPSWVGPILAVLVAIACAALAVVGWARWRIAHDRRRTAHLDDARDPDLADDLDDLDEGGADDLDAPSTALVPLPRPAADHPRDRRLLALLSTVAPLGVLGAYVHHRRFVQYHAHKGSKPTTSFPRWIGAELRGASLLGWWHVRGLLPDRFLHPNRGAEAPAAVVPPRLVVCVHGYSQTAANFVGLRRVLAAAGRESVAITLGFWLAPMSWYAGRLERKLERYAGEHPEGIDVVAHSMGGVVLRMVLASRPDLGEKLRTVITLGTPHRGTAAARGIPLLPEIRALKRRSALLRELPSLPSLVPNGRVVTIAGDADTVVYPLETAIVDGSEAIVLRGVGHAGLLTTPRAWAAVRRALSAA